MAPIGAFAALTSGQPHAHDSVQYRGNGRCGLGFRSAARTRHDTHSACCQRNMQSLVAASSGVANPGPIIAVRLGPGGLPWTARQSDQSPRSANVTAICSLSEVLPQNAMTMAARQAGRPKSILLTWLPVHGW